MRIDGSPSAQMDEAGVAHTEVVTPLEGRRSLADDAADKIRAAILAGTVRQGDRLSDFHLAKQMGTSRGPAREALKLLCAEGLVVQIPNKGSFVARVSPEDIRDIYELRSAVESRAARVLAERHSQSDVAALRRLTEKMILAAERGAGSAVSRADIEFHETLCLLTGNRRLHGVFMREVPTMFALLRFDEAGYQPLSEMARELVPLVDAIEAGDSVQASRLIEEHIARACELAGEQMRMAAAE